MNPRPAATAALMLLTSTAAGAPKPLINYFRPMPIVGSLSTAVWGGSTVGARDPKNGLEDDGSKGGVSAHQETNYYWDGKIIKGEDGKYHLYASHWTYSNGFGPPIGASGTGWQSSIPMHAVSDDIMGPYVSQGDCYDKNQEGNNKGHNTTALVTPTGAAPYTLSVGEIVAGQMFSASSASGPWTLLGPIKTDTHGHDGCGTLSSNFTFTVGPDNRFWATSRNGCVMDSDAVLGTYQIETDSILPNLENNDNANAEDQVIWHSGGYFHIVYNYWNVQRAYHIMSKDGISNWTSTGLAYQAVQTPANANSNWLRYSDGTVNQWHNMERASVYQEDGHVTYFTFAVTDVDKNTSAVNSGGSKIIVVPFDGVQFDCDNGDAASCAEVASGGTGGTGGASGAAGVGGAGGGGQLGQGGRVEAAGAAGLSAGGSAGAGRGGQPDAGAAGSGTAGITAGIGGMGGTGGKTTSGTGGTGDAGSRSGATSGAAGNDSSLGGGAGTAGAANRDGPRGQPAGNGGCSCRVGTGNETRSIAALLVLAAMSIRRRRGSRSRSCRWSTEDGAVRVSVSPCPSCFVATSAPAETVNLLMHRALLLVIAATLLACSQADQGGRQNGSSGGGGGLTSGSGGRSQGNGGSNAATSGSAGRTQSTGGNQGDGGSSASGGAAGSGNAGGADAGGLPGSGGAALGGSGGVSAAGGQAGSGGSGGIGGAQPIGARVIQNFNQSWKFKRSDVTGADATDFDDSSWQDIGLPHSFNLPSFINAKFYAGYGWYRKHFAVPASWATKSVSLEFQAAFDQAQIYVNGKAVGEHIGGYNGFSIDITSAIKTGDNVVAVRLNNNWNAQIPPITGDHIFQGGIYRDVNVVVTDPLHVTWYGTWVTTPTLATNSGSSSTVEIKTEVQNDRAATVNATLKTDIVDKDGKVVATVSSQQAIDAGKTVTFDQTTPAISDPSLWHPDHPTLYRALSYLSDDTGTADEFTSPFGFRWFSWSATQGFSLNGSHYWIQGGNVHQDHAGWGIGVSDSALYRDVKLVKDAGMNFIRGSHYPKAPAFADACDELGILFWSENCFWGGFGGGPGGWSYSGAYPSTSADFDKYDANVLASLTEMIRIHRNHPSIIVWSMGNEDFFNGGGPADRVIALLKKEVDLTHQLDPLPTGRPAAIGGAQAKIGSTEPGTLGDIAGYNGDGTGYNDPGIPNMVSEYGADVSATRPGAYDPGWGNLTVSNGMAAQPAWRSGISRWCIFDYASQMGTTYINSGIVDNFRIPKRPYYWYRNAYAKVPPPTWPAAGTAAAVKLTASTVALTAVDGTQDAWLLVTVVDAAGTPLSNTATVTLTIKSGPGEFPTGTSITFTPPGGGSASDIAMRDGQAAIEFRTYYSGASVIEATSAGLMSSSVTILSQGSPAWVEGTTPPVAPRPYQP